MMESAGTTKNCTKKCAGRAQLLLIKPIAYFKFSLPPSCSLLKLPIDPFTDTAAILN